MLFRPLLLTAGKSFNPFTISPASNDPKHLTSSLPPPPRSFIPQSPIIRLPAPSIGAQWLVILIIIVIVFVLGESVVSGVHLEVTVSAVIASVDLGQSVIIFLLLYNYPCR